MKKLVEKLKRKRLEKQINKEGKIDMFYSEFYDESKSGEEEYYNAVELEIYNSHKIVIAGRVLSNVLVKWQVQRNEEQMYFVDIFEIAKKEEPFKARLARGKDVKKGMDVGYVDIDLCKMKEDEEYAKNIMTKLVDKSRIKEISLREKSSGYFGGIDTLTGESVFDEEIESRLLQKAFGTQKIHTKDETDAYFYRLRKKRNAKEFREKLKQSNNEKNECFKEAKVIINNEDKEEKVK